MIFNLSLAQIFAVSSILDWIPAGVNPAFIAGRVMKSNMILT